MNGHPTLFDEEPPDDRVPCPTCHGTGTVTQRELHELLDQPGKVGRDHPETSRRAAMAHPRFGTQRYRVLQVLDVCAGATAAEVAARTGINRNQSAVRLLELREGGFATYLRDDAGDVIERPTGPRDRGLVQTITPLGRLALAQ